MPEATFQHAASKCSLGATTYLHRNGILLDEPLIDFTKEPDPSKALACFNSALENADHEAAKRGATHISYVWEWRA